MTTIDTAALRKLAEAATPGPWHVQYGDDQNSMCMTGISNKNDWTGNRGQFADDLIAITFHQMYPTANYEGDDLGENNSAFIAAFNPDTAVALLDRLEAAEAPKPKLPGHRHPYFILANGRLMLSDAKSKRTPNWVLASTIFACGSNSGYEICAEAGIDPDSYKVERVVQPRATHQGATK